MIRTAVASVVRAAARNQAHSLAAVSANVARICSSCGPQAAATPSYAAYKLAAALLATTTMSLGLAKEALAEPSQERTFIAIKPDGVHRGLISEIIKRFETKGYKLVAVKLLVPNKDLAGSHYAEHDGKPFYPKLVNFLTSGPVLAMVWEGKEVIKYGRTMIGATNPLASAPGTIRGDYGVDMGRNIIHGSDSIESAQREIALWFRPEELTDWKPVATSWIYE